jgi:hypothetical protein
MHFFANENSITETQYPAFLMTQIHEGGQLIESSYSGRRIGLMVAKWSWMRAGRGSTASTVVLMGFGAGWVTPATE